MAKQEGEAASEMTVELILQSMASLKSDSFQEPSRNTQEVTEIFTSC